jgi:hypothetical protein
LCRCSNKSFSLKLAEVQRKAAKDQMDAQLRMQQQQIEQQRIATQTEVEGAKLGAQIAKDKTQKEFDEATRAVDDADQRGGIGSKNG